MSFGAFRCRKLLWGFFGMIPAETENILEICTLDLGWHLFCFFYYRCIFCYISW